MKTITMVQTFDGLRHDSAQLALRHLDKIYGDALGSIARELVQLDSKYSKLCDYIDKNADKFATLATVKADMKMQESNDYE